MLHALQNKGTTRINKFPAEHKTDLLLRSAAADAADAETGVGRVTPIPPPEPFFQFSTFKARSITHDEGADIK